MRDAGYCLDAPRFSNQWKTKKGDLLARVRATAEALHKPISALTWKAVESGLDRKDWRSFTYWNSGCNEKKKQQMIDRNTCWCSGEAPASTWTLHSLRTQFRKCSVLHTGRETNIDYRHSHYWLPRNEKLDSFVAISSKCIIFNSFSEYMDTARWKIVSGVHYCKPKVTFLWWNYHSTLKCTALSHENLRHTMQLL